MAGVVVLTVGAVQFKQEIYLYSITITRTPSEKCTLWTKPWLWHSESNDVISGNSNLHLTGGRALRVQAGHRHQRLRRHWPRYGQAPPQGHVTVNGKH